MEWLAQLMSGFGVMIVSDPVMSLWFLVTLYSLDLILGTEEKKQDGMGTREF